MKKILFFLLFCQCTYGQKIVKDLFKDYKDWKQNLWDNESIFKYTALGVVQQNLQQQSFSQNQFRGVGLAILSSKIIDRPKYELGVERYFAGLPFYKSENGTANSYSGNASLARHYLRKINKNFSVGAQISLNVSARIGPEYDNNTFATEIFSSFNPKIKYMKDFRLLKRNFAVDYSLSAAVASIGFWTPSFTSNFTNNQLGVFLPNTYNAINSRFLLHLPNKKRVPTIRPIIGYGWNLQSLVPSKYPNVINGTHTLYLIANLHKIK